MMEYESSKFWQDLCNVSSPAILEERLNFEASRLKEFLVKDESNVFSTWIAFFSVSTSTSPNVKLFSWLLSFYPEITSKHSPLPVSYVSSVGNPKRDYTGCTLLQMMMLLKPFREYFHLLSHTLATCDTEGNSTLFYAILSGNFWIYKHCWALLGDGSSAKSPGPQTVLLMIKADWMSWMKKECEVKQLIEVIGGLNSAISKCLQANSPIFTRLLMSRPGSVAFEVHLKQALSEPGIDLRTFVAVIETALQGDKNFCSHVSIDEILKRAFSVCKTDKDFYLCLRLTRTIKEQFKLTESLDDLVAFTGSPYEFLRLVYAYPTAMNTLNKLSDLRIDVFDLRSSVFGSYLHVVCKRIGEFEPYQRYGLHSLTLNSWYLDKLFECTLSRHWRVKDTQGNLPIDYLKPVFHTLDVENLEEIKRRSYGAE